MIRFAARTLRFDRSPSQIASARARDLRAQGRDIITLTAGEPDFPTPDNVKRAVAAALERNETKYTAVEGTIALREAVSAKFKRDNGLDYAPDQILCGAGAKQVRSEEHTSELQSLMRISYAVFCLKKKNITQKEHTM